MTEEEAKKKWCPQARINSGLGSAWNRPSFPGTERCLASECMAWRWGVEDNPYYHPPHSLMVPSDPRQNPMYIISKTHGYCGLAGRT